MLSQEEQRYAERFIHAVESGQAKLIPDKTFRDYITDYMKADEHARINRVVRRLGCYYALLKELLDRHATPSNIDDRGTFTELKKSVNKTKAENFFRKVFKENYVPLRLPIYSEEYLRDFIFSGGKDPYLYVIEEETTNMRVAEEPGEYNKPKVVVVKLTDEDYAGREVKSSVNYKTLENWYSESKAVKSVVDSECFAYVEDKLCVATSEYMERTDDGKIRLTEYAKTHEEECFLQFVVDEKDGTLHYVKLPKSKADEAFNYNDAITDDLLSQYGLVNEMSKEMINAIDGAEFGTALDILMDKHICNYSARLLRSITGLDNRTISNMKKGQNLTKSNVVSACLGIHIPFRVSSHMLSLADLSLNMTSKGKLGDENETYDMLLHLRWTADYGDIYDELKEQAKEHLIHQPPL
ncbi:type I restriction enzyme endonuclease subunit [Mediterraneibacter gnavus CAG:126]|uniref:Type I restriction enzyme endonuclease subunit n=2 Tax=Mediterraneibacter gnavus TaxID=33038 RepID=R5TKL3_MEDGN|nr:type I restriction enzyme endonuclease subunit [Mediterraneibacter gnavus CAG:126]